MDNDERMEGDELMKKGCLFALLVVLVLCSAFANDGNTYNVSFFNIKSVPKVFYSIEHEGKKIDVDLTKIYEVSSDDRIYSIVETGSEHIEVTSFELRSYDGNKKIIRTLDADETEDGKQLCFSLGDLGALKEWSIAPLLIRKPRIITMEALVKGEPVGGGTWRVNKNVVNGDSSEISPLTDFSVSYTFDAGSYYFVSSSPKELAESGGQIVFPLQKGSEDDSLVDSNYTVNLKRYSSISLGEKEKRFKKLLYNGQEYNSDNIGSLKLKAGDSFDVYTEANYVVAGGSGLKIDNTSNVSGEWVTKLEVPEESPIYKYTINIIKQKEAKFKIMLEGFNKKEEVKDSGITVSVDGKEIPLTFEKKGTDVDVSESKNLIINIPQGSSKERYGIFFSGSNDSLDDCDDIKEEYEEKPLSYKELKDLEKITIKKEKGFRVGTIQQQINRAKELKVEVGYYDNQGKRLNDGTFLPVGSSFSVSADNIPEDVEVKINGGELKKGDHKKIEIDENTNNDVFKLDIEQYPGFWINFKELACKNGSITVTRGGDALKGRRFIKVGDKITWEAVPDKGFEVSGNKSGDFEIRTVDDKSKFEELFSGERFLDKSKSEEYSKTIVLKNPKYGDVVYYDNGDPIQSSEEGEVYARHPVVANDEELIHISYKYVNNPVSGFDYPTIKENDRTVDGWECKNEEDGLITCTKKLDEKECELTPIELEELSNSKPAVKINVAKEVIKTSNGGFYLSYLNGKSNVVVYEKGKSEEKGKSAENGKISSTNILILEFRGYDIPDGKVLQIKYSFKYADHSKRDFSPIPFRTRDKNFSEYKIDSHLAKKGDYSPVEKIEIEISFVCADTYRDIIKDNASVEVKMDDKTLDSSFYVSPDDEVTLIVKPNEGFYIEGKDNEQVKKLVKYKNLKQELDKIVVKKYISVKLENIHPKDNMFCKYVVNGKDVSYGQYKLKEGDKVTVVLKDMGNGYKVNSPLLKVIAKFTNKDGNFKEELTINSNHQGKSLTLEDFNIEEVTK